MIYKEWVKHKAYLILKVFNNKSAWLTGTKNWLNEWVSNVCSEWMFVSNDGVENTSHWLKMLRTN